MSNGNIVGKSIVETPLYKSGIFNINEVYNLSKANRWPKVVKDGLVLYLDSGDQKSYPGSGTTWNDLSGNGSNGTLVNAPTYSANNKGTLVLNGTNQYVTGVHNSVVDIVGDITVDCWFKITSTAASWVRVFGKGDATNRPYGLWYNAAANNFLYQRYGSVNVSVVFTANINKNVWYNLVGTTSGSTHTLYLNGIQVATTALTSTILSSTQPYGLCDPTTALYHTGEIANAKLYNRALTATEIARNYAAFIDDRSYQIENFNAYGGTITESGGYRIHTFTGSGTFGVTKGSKYVEYLVVAGGGGGGAGNGAEGGGGGGAGGMLTGAAVVTTATIASVVVGAGGAGGASQGANGGVGSASSAIGISASGGGLGTATGTGGAGGSGGGAGRTGLNGGAGVAGQGNAGGGFGAGTGMGWYAGGGGGGKAAVGAKGGYATGGAGGAGLASAISGTSKNYAGGGGGGSGGAAGAAGTTSAGGIGGGGNGGSDKLNTPSTAATPNTGGGGGGGPGHASENGADTYYPAAAGGSGIVIIRYLIQD